MFKKYDLKPDLATPIVKLIYYLDIVFDLDKGICEPYNKPTN